MAGRGDGIAPRGAGRGHLRASHADREQVIGTLKVPAGEIAAAFAVTKPAISQHLAVLREAGLATATVSGNSRRYRARQEALRGLHAALGDPDKWSNASDVPERALPDARTMPVVVASTEVDTDQATTYAAFMEAAWATVLGRLKARVVSACDPGAATAAWLAPAD